MSTASDAWNARQHEVITARTRKGRTTQRVVRFGRASITGALDVDAVGNPLLSATGPDVHVIDPSSAAARLLVRAMERNEIGRTRVGLSALDIDAITREAYGDLLPAVVGSTDVRQYEQVIHRSRSESADVTTHTCDITGGRSFEIGTTWIAGEIDARRVDTPDGRRIVPTGRVHRDPTIADIYAPGDAYGPQTDTYVAWPTRGNYGVTIHGRLPYERRATDPRTDVTVRMALPTDAPIRATGYAACVRRVVRVVTAGPDVVGLPTVERVEHPTIAPRQDVRFTRGGTRLVGTSGVDVHGRSYGRIPVGCPGVSSVTRLDGSAVHDVQHHPAVTERVERLFHGFTAVDRAPAIVKTSDALEQRTTETADAPPADRDAWAALIARLEPGKRADLGTCTVTFAARGDRYSATFRDGRKRIQSRTVDGMADALAAA